MRSTLLALSRNRALAARIPNYRFARAAVRRFMPGEELDAALRASADFAPAGMGTVLTRLGENLSSLDEADAVASHYREVLDRIAATGLDVRISVKLTQLGFDLDDDRARVHVDALCAHAARSGNEVWIDIESSEYVDRTIGLFRAVARNHRNVGLCLQAYLKRTAKDLDSLLATTAAIRLVKGAYNEPASISFRSQEDIDSNYARLASRLLGAAALHSDAPSPVLATHDTRLIDRISKQALASDIPPRAYEVQMLYGIRPDEQRRLASTGYRVRVLISYGPAWFPWFMRRLAERPANVWFVARNLVVR
jgi:proline dehydrogenase